MQKWDKPCEQYFLKKYCKKPKLHLCRLLVLSIGWGKKKRGLCI